TRPKLHHFPTRRSSDLKAQLELPEAARSELAALVGDRLRDDDDARRTFAVDGWPLGKVWTASGDVAAYPAAVVASVSAEEVRERSEEHTSELQSRFDLV